MNTVKQLQRRMDQARKNAQACVSFAEANPPQSAYWRNVARQVHAEADKIEEEVLRLQHRISLIPPPIVRTDNVIEFRRRA